VDATDFFGDDREPAGPQTYDRYGRYQLDADGQGLKPYTRATTLAKTLEDTYHLSEWQARCAARGVALRDDLVARAKATPVEDKRVWKEILAEAEVVNAGGAKRNMGSAFHEFHERAPKMSGEEFAAQHPLIKATYAKYHAALKQCGIEEILTEVTLVNTKIGSAGKADGIARLKDGRYVIIDRKSGRITEYPHSACQQLAIYANSDVMIAYDENGATVRHELPPIDKHTAIVIDVTIGDEQTANVAVYELDIWSGWAAALLACDVRRWRNRRDLVKPFHPDAPARSAAEGPSTAGQFHISAAAGQAYAAVQDAQVATDLATQVRDEVQAIANAPAAAYAGVSETGDGIDVLPPARVPDPVEVAHGPAANAGMDATLLGINAAVADVSPAAAASVAAHLSDHPAGQATVHQAYSSAEQRNIPIAPDGTRAPDPHYFVAVPGQLTCGAPGCGRGGTDPVAQHIVDRPIDAAAAKVAAAGPISPENLATAAAQVADVDALLSAFKTKAQMQAAARTVDPDAALNRTRANLAKDMVGKPAWAQHRAQLLGIGEEAVSPEQLAQHMAAPVESFSAVVTPAPGPVPPDPTPTAAQWTPEEAAVGEQQPPWEVPAAAEKTPEEKLLDMIAAATTTGPGSELAAVWAHAQANGIAWTARLQQAGEIRHKALAADGATTKGA